VDATCEKGTQLNRQQLRASVAKRLRWTEVPDPIWEDLEADGEVQAALDGGHEEGEDLVRAARRLRERARAYAAWEAKAPRAVERSHRFDPGTYVVERSRAAMEAMALEATGDPAVRDFRQRFLDGRPLSVKDARRLLASPAAALLDARWFERMGVPIVGHRSIEVSRQIELTPGAAERVAIDLRVETPSETHEVSIAPLRPVTRPAFWSVLAFVDETGERFETEVRAHSVLDALRRTAERLGIWYDWSADHAAWFVLTDAPPPPGALRVGYRLQHLPARTVARVTIEVEPWVSADLVEWVYRDVQRELLGRENRPVSARNVAVLRSVLQGEREAMQRDPDGSGPTVAEAMDRWNAEHPEARYNSRWLFDRDANRARRSVLYPKYQSSGEDEEATE
jgi:enamine deaminase RidA (YjgF/YER057c/UK114 family)